MKSCRGFTLVELAMVLFVVSLLLGGLLVPLATQIEARQRSDAEAQLEKIREALIGFAIINGRLPCHTTEPNPASASYGEENLPCNTLTTDGILPWKTLGLNSGYDPWGVPRNLATDPWTGFWRYRIDNNFYTTFSLNTTTTSFLSVRELDTANSTPGSPVFNEVISTSERPIAIFYSTGANQLADGENSSFESAPTSAAPAYYERGDVNNLDRDGDGNEDEFDDITIWLTRPLLFNRMVSAGVLP